VEKLIDGIHQFQKEDFLPLQGLFEQLAKGQNPETLFITCSDSRIDPNLLSRSKPGDLFILRNAGNIIPAHGTSANGEAATVEFAVAALGVRDVIVCGHSHCGAMKALIKPEIIAEMPAMQGWLAHSEATRRIIRENYRDLNDDELLMAAIEENVLVQIEHLQTLPAVAARRARGAIHLHAWVYQFETGDVFAYDPRQQQFVPLRRLERAPTEPAEIRGQPI
jgi:carbonic anhydrase